LCDILWIGEIGSVSGSRLQKPVALFEGFQAAIRLYAYKTAERASQQRKKEPQRKTTFAANFFAYFCRRKVQKKISNDDKKRPFENS
jgi:hypothetical protein